MKQRGDAHFAEEQTALALADYERALDLGGPDLDIRIALGRVHYEIDNYEAARAVLDRAVALDAESPEAHYWHGLVLYGLGRNHDAVVAFGKTLPLHAGAADAYLHRYPSFADVGCFPPAVADLHLAADPATLHDRALHNPGRP